MCRASPSARTGPGSSIWLTRILRDAIRILIRQVHVFELYSRQLDGSGSVTKLNPPLVPGGFVQALRATAQIDATSTRAIYLATQDAANVRELYTRALDGWGTATKLNGPWSPTATRR